MSVYTLEAVCLLQNTILWEARISCFWLNVGFGEPRMLKQTCYTPFIPINERNIQYWSKHANKFKWHIQIKLQNLNSTSVPSAITDQTRSNTSTNPKSTLFFQTLTQNRWCIFLNREVDLVIQNWEHHILFIDTEFNQFWSKRGFEDKDALQEIL